MTEPYFGDLPAFVNGGLDPDKKFYPVARLRYWVPALDSEDYRLKMEIVEEFARQGVDYWATEIPEHTLRIIKNVSFAVTCTKYIHLPI